MRRVAALLAVLPALTVAVIAEMAISDSIASPAHENAFELIALFVLKQQTFEIFELAVPRES